MPYIRDPSEDPIDPTETSQAERERFSQLYAANLPSLLVYAIRRAPTPEDAADAVSEAFLVAWRRIDEVPEGEETRLWLYGVARRVLANQRRSEVRRTKLSERLRVEFARLPDRATGSREELAELRTALERLRPPDRELLGLIAWEGLGPRELAKALGCSRNAAKIRTHRARRRLRRELEALESKPSEPTGHEGNEDSAQALPIESGE